MTPEMRVQILEGAKSAFFEAMIDGYVGGENRRSVKVKDDDGYTTITYTTEDGKYKVEDRFCTNPFSDEAAGTTTVFCRFALIWAPVWWMEYSGHYTEGVIPLLKSALTKAYERRLFLGGRGLARVDDKSYVSNDLKFNLTYTNTYHGDFSSFDGTEKIIQNPLDGFDPETIGYHKYSGMSLL
ncbi:MAG: hypothetical protein A2431_01940 [Candidatus Zambryskibacteria bacterium RIFOXYC1_FULL_39_10]|uniref:DUF5680 domain-containing protein n=1 Tax=Candidatus Zambryskibacteria bacterium RIFOXYC1_FULL_39_10 TaxID=1802779 RepID=A0A1G2V469_9BACT|nr:MAG: hypothetical protein A2605_02790 [Candidatus Zambryskibacteria bacterium RIFOXYD1_FULL_39_35]OHB16437.1 MAG: hypothetical protein A2431_01940 [Candidatus Zambryskibacteria bacterium RIFOXYC1_FULL_39_10]